MQQPGHERATVQDAGISGSGPVVGDFNTPLPMMNRVNKPKKRRRRRRGKGEKEISKDVEDLNNIVNHLCLIASGRKLNWKTPKYTFFPSACESCVKIDYILDHKINLNNISKTVVLQIVF